MTGMLPRRLDWQPFAFVAYVTINLYMIAAWMDWTPYDADIAIWDALATGLATGTLYDLTSEIPFVWSPVIAPVQALVGATGFWTQAAVQLATVVLLRDWRLIVLVLSSFFFWPAILGENPLFTLTLVAGMLAWRGSDRWALVYLALSVMIPRPLQIPLMVLLLWERSRLRLPFLIGFAVHALLVLGSGYALPWAQVVIEQARTPVMDIGPRTLITPYWLWISIPFGVLFVALRKPGWAGLFFSPYWLGGYFLWPLIDAAGRTGERARRLPSGPSEFHSRPSFDSTIETIERTS